MTMLAGMGPTLGKQAPPAKPAVSITITERAAVKAKQLLAEKGHDEGMLRVFVVGGGCSGYQYGMAIADAVESDDQVVDGLEGVRIVVDEDSIPMISGAEIDYVEDLMKSGFTIYNPNATSSCACGSSFQAAGSAGTPRPCH
ncbi:MAG: iron-sulfur cluster assembly accessory protein [Dehalococcoidia bacterium]|nr:iron-sulfur cluster assembly accessory protein [Dehalococcoidia bacterium]